MYQDRIEVPWNLVGRVIGRGGATITTIEGRHGCKITIGAEGTFDRPTPVEVKGPTALAVAGAVADISALIPAQRFLKILRDKAGRLIGKGGANIRRLKALYGVDVSVYDPAFDDGAQAWVLVKEGRATAAVAAAEADIQAHLAQPQDGAVVRTLSIPSRARCKVDEVKLPDGCHVKFPLDGQRVDVHGPSLEVVMEAVDMIKRRLGWLIRFRIPTIAAGSLIGLGGAIVRGIESLTQCTVAVGEDVDGQREVVITGNSERTARNALTEVLRRAGLLARFSQWKGCPKCVFNAPEESDARCIHRCLECRRELRSDCQRCAKFAIR
jgi:rRNA processing protein Krr1/Pno1